MNNKVGIASKNKHRKSRKQSRKTILPAKAILDSYEKVFLEEIVDNDSDDGETTQNEPGEIFVDPSTYRIFDSEGKTLFNAEKGSSEGWQVTFLLTNQRKQFTFEMTFSLNRTHPEALILYNNRKDKLASLSRSEERLTILNYQGGSILTLDEPKEGKNFDTDEFKVKTIEKQEVVGSLKKLETEVNSNLPEGALEITFQKDLDTTIKAIMICACIYFHHSTHSKNHVETQPRCHSWLPQGLRTKLNAMKCS